MASSFFNLTAQCVVIDALLTRNVTDQSKRREGNNGRRCIDTPLIRAITTYSMFYSQTKYSQAK